jgi:long-chain acyl-CoA synthetase
MTTPDPTDQPHLRSVTSMLRHWAAVRPDAPMCTLGPVTVSWSGVYGRAVRVAGALASCGVRTGDRVAFLDRNCIEYFEVFFGCALLGAVIVPVNWRLAPPEMAAVAADAGAVVLVHGPDFDQAAAVIGDRAPTVRTSVSITGFAEWRDAGAGGAAGDPGFEPGPDDVVTQMYTSGTTGLPKGVMISGRNIAAILDGAVEKYRVGPDTVSMVAMPLFHIGGTGWALAGMSRGGHSVIVRDVDPVEVLRVVEEHSVTGAFVVPAVLMMLLASPRLASTDVSSLDTIFYGASPISEDVLVRSMEALGCDFVQVYGLTETTGAITTLAPEDHDPHGSRSYLLRSAGRPLSYVELRIVDPVTGEGLPAGAVGEITARSDQTMLGYWDKPTETAAVLSEDGWFRTGDAGWLSEDGYLFLHDRIKDMIVSGGENVYPAEVENALQSHPGVADAAVFGVPDHRWGETVKAVIVRSPGAEGDDGALATDILAATRSRLAHYKCPTSIDFVEALPRNPSGKVLKRELRAPYWEGQERNIG